MENHPGAVVARIGKMVGDQFRKRDALGSEVLVELHAARAFVCGAAQANDNRIAFDRRDVVDPVAGASGEAFDAGDFLAQRACSDVAGIFRGGTFHIASKSRRFGSAMAMTMAQSVAGLASLRTCATAL